MVVEALLEALFEALLEALLTKKLPLITSETQAVLYSDKIGMLPRQDWFAPKTKRAGYVLEAAYPARFYVFQTKTIVDGVYY